ncbi:MAG TPA: hypothetical protein VIJ94_15420 [Caulobacteraceae bacterium]
MNAVWKIPEGWRPSLADRTALYPALYLRWAGHHASIAADPPFGAWAAADLRVLVSDGPFSEDERELMRRTAGRGLGLVLAPQRGLLEADRSFAAELGCAIAAWRDPGPLASAPPGERRLELTGCPARLAEDRILLAELGLNGGADAPAAGRRIVVVAESAESLAAVWPAVEQRLAMGGVEVFVVGEGPARTISADDAALLALIGGAEAFLCVFPTASPDDPSPAQWVRSALYAGAPVIAASHPSLDGLAHLCVLDDWERGLQLYARFPAERLKPVALAQAELAERIQPEAIAREWLAAAKPPGKGGAPQADGRPTLVTLIDIHQDLDVLLPVLLALKARGEVRQRLVLSDWLLEESPRAPAALTTHGFEFTVHPRAAIRAGEAPSLAGAGGALSGADTNTRAHKAGHTLLGRARDAGLPTFTLQHGLENIGLTYKDHLHGEDIRFAAETVFTWGAPEGLAPWVPEETRAKVVPVGSPKTTPPPAAAQGLHQGRWARVIGVFENLHWHRFSELYLERALFDLQAAAESRPDTLFLVKPHHAGRWLSRHPERLRARANLVVVDPTDSAWEPHTAPALIASVDMVLTTPSTVALDAARTGRPVAVLGYDLELPLYEPLPIVRGADDLGRFLEMGLDDALRLNEAFLRRAVLPGRADHRIAAVIGRTLRERRTAKPPRRRLFSA